MANINRNDSLVFMTVNSSLLTSWYYNTTNSVQLSTDDQTPDNSQHLNLVQRLTTHITLIVSIIGLIGNACTIIVLNRQSMRKWRSSMLLSALAGVDFLYLSIILLSIIDTLTHQAIGLHRSLILCQATVYITHICSFLSANFTLSFTLQRFVAVLFPLHANTIISTRSSTINIVILSIFGCGFYSFSFFVTNISNEQCQEDENHPALFPLLIVDTCLTFIIPFIFILLFNCAIVYKLRNRKKLTGIFGGSLTTATSARGHRTSSPVHVSKADLYHERQRLYESNSNNNDCISSKDGNQPSNGLSSSNRKISSSCIESAITGNEYIARLSHPRASTATMSNELSPVTSSSNPTNNRQAISQRTTKMLVICSTTFLLFNSPYCAVLLYCIVSKIVLTQLLAVLRHFFFMSFCLNFFLYSLCGNRFRHELILLFKACCRKCSTRNIRSHWLRMDKIPQQTGFTRVNIRPNV